MITKFIKISLIIICFFGWIHIGLGILNIVQKTPLTNYFAAFACLVAANVAAKFISEYFD